MMNMGRTSDGKDPKTLTVEASILRNDEKSGLESLSGKSYEVGNRDRGLHVQTFKTLKFQNLEGS